MTENRLNPRYELNGIAWVLVQNRWAEVHVENLSYSGIGLRIPLGIWARIKNDATLEGKLRAYDLTCRYEGDVMWSRVAFHEVLVGVEIKDYIAGNLATILHAATSKPADDAPEFNL